MSPIRRGREVAGLLAAGTLLFAACGGGGGDDDDGGADVEPGLEACVDNPNDCNAGERAEGGEATWLINQGHDGVFNSNRTEGNSVYLVQMETGLYTNITFAGAGGYTPAGEWQYNSDLFAEEPEIVNEDPLTVHYVIREEAVWSDGEPINVDDVIWHWYHNSGKPEHCTECNPASTTFFDTTASIEAADEAGKDIEITYDDGWTHPEWFSRGFISYPAHVATEAAGDWQNDPEAMTASSQHFLNTVPSVFSGPYVVESWTPDETQVMVPNENWYGETQPALGTIVKQIIPDQPSWLPAIENGEIDGGTPSSFTPDILNQMSQSPTIYATTGTAGAVWEHVDFNMDSVTDPALRKAIFTAIDVADAHERIWGEIAPPLRGNHIFSSVSKYYEDHLTDTGYGSGDVEAARGILEDAGYTGFESGGQLVDPNGEPVKELRFGFLSGNQNRDTFTQLTQSYLAEIGVTATPTAIPPDDLGTVLTGQDYDMVIFGWSGSPLFADSPFQFYHSESGSNFGKVKNDELDQLVSDMREQSTQDESAELAQQAVQIVLDEAYSIPLWDTPNMMFVSDQLVNLRDNHNTSARALYNVEEWGRVAVQ